MSAADDLAALSAAATDPLRVGGRKKADAGVTSPHKAATAWRMTVDSTGADLDNIELEEQINRVEDWDGVLRHFALDPEQFEVVDDTVRMSSWQQSKALEDGTRDLVWLYSYKARFRKITDRLPTADVDKLAKRIAKWKVPTNRRIPGTGLGAPSTFYAGWADWQMGKSAGEGVEGTTQRILDSFEMQAARVKELRKVGRNIERAAFWNMGDPTEGCDSNYSSQLFTVQLTRREQLNAVLDLWTTGLRELAPMFDAVEFGSVLCNHGEWGRQGVGTKSATPDSDNIGGYLGDTLQKVLAGRPGLEHITYNVPHDAMYQLTDMSGVPVALTHGHKIVAANHKTEGADLLAQGVRMLRELGREPRLWMTAHRHHYQVVDYGPFHRIQHPSIDYGSKYFSDMKGAWSSPGTFTCLVGEHAQAGGPLAGATARGFSDELVLVAK